MKGARQVAFDLGAYDAGLPLVIDPVLVYSSYLGGPGTDQGNAIAVDAGGNAYVTGTTNSAAPGGTLLHGPGGGNDVFVSKVSPDGLTLIYMAYLGGSAADDGRGIAVDSFGNAYVTGSARTGFPATIGLAFSATAHVFVAKLNSAGGLSYSKSLVGGLGTDEGRGIAVDAGGNAYVTGLARSSFPITVGPGFAGGATDAFVAKVTSAGSTVYARFLGSGGADDGRGIAADGAGNAYVTGLAASGFPMAAPPPAVAFDTTFGGGLSDAFVAKINDIGSTLVYSTYLGGNGDDDGRAIAIDAAGNAYVTGLADSDLATPTTGSFDPNRGGKDAYVAKFNATGSAVLYFTYVGGSVTDDGRGIAVDAAGKVHLTGQTASSGSGSTGFPRTTGAADTSYGGGGDAFITTLALRSLGPKDLVYSTYLGGSGADAGNGIAVDADGNAYVAGVTNSADFHLPVLPGYDPTHNGVNDAFVAKLSARVITLVLTPATATRSLGEEHQVTVTATDEHGNAAVDVIVLFSVNGTPSGSIATDGNGLGTFAYFGPLTPAIDTITAYPDANNNGVQDALEASASATVEWSDQSATATSVVSDVNPSRFGQLVTFTATVTASSTVDEGTVTFLDGATPISPAVPVMAGQADFSTSSLSVDTHTITAEYSGTSTYGASAGSVSQVVNKGDTATLVTSSLNPSTYGEAVLLTATVAAVLPAAGSPSGFVTFFDGATSLGPRPVNGSGQAFLETSTLVAASHSITAVYGGDGSFNPGTSPVYTQEVNQAATTTTLSSSLPSPTVFGQTLTFTALVDSVGAQVPPGTVTFSDGATLLAEVPVDAAGEASIALSSLVVGSHSINAEYIPAGSDFLGSTATAFPHAVNLAPTTTSVTSSPNPSIYSQDVTITATVTAVEPGARTIAFTPPFSVPAGAAGTFAVASGDVNGDGLVDLVSANRTASNVSVMLGNGSPIDPFDPPTHFALGGSPAYLLAVDLNDDGILDLVTANETSDSISVLQGNGDGTFTPAPGSPLTGGLNDPTSVAAADFNGDGNLDLAVSNGGNLTLHVRFGDGNLGFGPPSNTGVGSRPIQVMTGHLDAGASVDIATVNFGSNTVTLKPNDGAGDFGTLINTAPFPPGVGPVAFVLADLNGDGTLDAATANRTSGDVTVRLDLQTTTPTVGSATRFDLGADADGVAVRPEYIVGADFNGDGRLDLAVTDSAHECVLDIPTAHTCVRILTGTGSGAFEFPIAFRTDVPAFAFVSNSPAAGRRFLAADLNGDGAVDLAFPTLDNDIKVLLNTGVGPTGTVEFFDGPIAPENSLGTAPLINGAATLPPIATLAVGTHTLTAQYASDGNYDESADDTTHVVGKIPITVAAVPGQTKTYGEVNPPLAYQVTSGALLAGDAFVGALARVGGEDVGTYAIQQGTLDINDNYLITFVGADFTITPRPVTATADPQTRFYGDADPALTYHITSGSLVFGDAFTGGLTRVTGENVGAYAIEQGTLALSTNYDLTYVGANLTITPRPVTVTADPQTRIYGNADPALTYQITSGSLVFGDVFTGGLTRVAGENVGAYAIEQGTLALSSNYDLTFVGADLTITPRPVTVTADPQTKVYGDADPALSYQITSGSLAFSDGFSGGLSRAPGEDIGAHAVQQGTLTLGANYDLTFAGADLTITPRPVTVTADPQTKIYGDADPALTYQITSGALAFTDAFSGALTRAAGETVGSYAIQQGTLALSPNYDLTFVGAGLAITPRPITVTADAKSKVYGNADPALTYQITSGSLVAGDAFTGGLTRAAGEDVGPHAIQQGTLALDANYDLTYVGANLTVTPRPATWTTNAASKVYGTADPSPLTTGSGNFLVSDGVAATYSRAAGETVAASPYHVTATLSAAVPGALNNYIITNAGGNFTITRRALDVTADDKSRPFGQPNPPLSGQVVGLVAGDPVTVTYSTMANASSSPGTYPIVPSVSDGGSGVLNNYNLTVTNGTLTVTPIAPGRMTGGGTFGSQRVHHGFTLHCDPHGGSNHLQVNWGKGNKFHLDQLTSADCSDSPGIAQGQPVAPFDTYRGTGVGRYNGAPATAEWTFTDAGEPGKNDTATIVIRNAAGQIVLSASGKISNGNHQAH